MISLADLPLESALDDSLGRDKIALDIANYLRSLPKSSSLTMAICGPWGSGKTSLFNLTRIHLKDSSKCTIIDFNPWFFSGAENLTQLFLFSLADQLYENDPKWKKLSKNLLRYGKNLDKLGEIPYFGIPFAFIGAIKKFFGKDVTQVTNYRKQIKNISKEFLKLDSPILVFIDDIDRLEWREILDVFKLVRLTANFSNINYILAFDREQVIRILDSANIDAKPYLEKIISVTISVPKASDHILSMDLTNLLDSELSDIFASGNFDQTRWPDIYAEIISPLISNHRDAKRYVSTLKLTLSSLAQDVEIVDLLALEAIRLFRPELFASLLLVQEVLTDTSSATNSNQEKQLRMNSLVTSNSQFEALVQGTIKRLFPAAEKYFTNTSYDGMWRSTWLKARRVAHPEILRLYFERFESAELKAFSIAKLILTFLDAKDLFDFLSKLEVSTLAESINALETFEDDYPVSSVVPVAVALLNSLPRLHELPPRGFLEMSPRIIINRVVLRLLRSIPAEERDRYVQEIFPSLESLSSKLALIELVGHRENVGHKLITLNYSKILEHGLLQEIRSTNQDSLIPEVDLLALLLSRTWWEPQSPRILTEPVGTYLIAAIFAASVSDSIEHSFDSRAARHVPHLQWDALLEIFEGVEGIRRALTSVEKVDLNFPKLAIAIDLIRAHLEKDGKPQSQNEL